MPIENFIRRRMIETFTELVDVWGRSGVGYASRVRLRRTDAGLPAERIWRLVVEAEDGDTADVVIPGFENLTASPITADLILRAALGSARITSCNMENSLQPTARAALTVVRDERE